jgi:hypothetical protein
MIGLEDGLGRSSLLGVKYDFYIRGPWFEVRDPAAVRSRATLLNAKPVSLFVPAKKVAREVLFKTPPQQSDYVPSGRPARKRTRLASRFRAQSRRPAAQHLSEHFYRESLPRLALVLIRSACGDSVAISLSPTVSFIAKSALEPLRLPRRGRHFSDDCRKLSEKPCQPVREKSLLYDLGATPRHPPHERDGQKVPMLFAAGQYA